MLFFFFFFQAEDGIRDIGVTGVQTCALPISWTLFGVSHLSTVAYAILVVDDWRMAAVFAANALCCLIILSLTAWKRAVFKATLMVLEAAVPSTEHPDVTAKSRVAGTTLTNKSYSRPFRLRVVSDRSGPS